MSLSGYYTDPAFIDKISPSTMTLVKTFTPPLPHEDVYVLTNLSGYIYVGYYMALGIVDKNFSNHNDVGKNFYRAVRT